MNLKIEIILLYESDNGVSVWSGKKNDYLTLMEWNDLVTRVKVQNFLESRPEEKRGGVE